MEGKESIGDVLASKIEQRKFTTRVVMNPVRDIIDLALYGDPKISAFVVEGEVLEGNVVAFGVSHWWDLRKMGFFCRGEGGKEGEEGINGKGC